MGWRELYDEEAVARAERLVASLIGTVTSGGEAFGRELEQTLIELGEDAELQAARTIQLLGSLVGLAHYAIMVAGYRGRVLDTYVKPDTSFDDSEQGAREAQVDVLGEAVERLHEIRATNFYEQSGDE